MRLQHRPDAAADRLAAVGGDHLDGNAEVVADEFEKFAQPHGFRWRCELCRRADRQIDHQMRGSGGELLRHDRGDHLLAGVEAERALDRNENIVGRRQVDVPAPDQTAVAGATTSFISSTPRSTRASTSIVSAVPAGDVMAREDVFGIVRPCAATIGTMIMEVRLPGMPPMQCLSTTIGLSHVSCVPACAMALVSDSNSSLVRKLAEPIRNAAISMSE